jgi:hypothetical protein
VFQDGTLFVDQEPLALWCGAYGCAGSEQRFTFPRRAPVLVLTSISKSSHNPLPLIALYSPRGTYNAQFLASYACINLDDPITRAPGVTHVQVFGAGQYARHTSPWFPPAAQGSRKDPSCSCYFT